MRTAARDAASVCSPGHSICVCSPGHIALRDCSKGTGGRPLYKVLVKGEFNTMKHSFYKRLFISHEDLMSP